MTTPAQDSGFALAAIALPAKMSVGSATWLHARLHFARLARWQTLWPWLALSVAAGLGGWLIARHSLEDAGAMQNYLQQFVLRVGALAGLALGVAAIRQDAEAGALPSFLLKPRAELALPIGRFLAVAAWSGLLGTAAVLLAVLGSWGSLLVPSSQLIGLLLLAAPLHAMAWSAICVGLGAWFKHAAAVALGWLVVGDAVLGQFSAAGGLLSPGLHVSRMLGTGEVQAQAVGLVNQLQGSGALPDIQPDPAGGALGLLVLSVLGAAAAVLRLQRDCPTAAAE